MKTQLELTKEINKLKSLRTFLWKGNKQSRKNALQLKINQLEILKTEMYGN